eukprot:4297296-Pleurochrysis_carterae.AAC.3
MLNGGGRRIPQGTAAHRISLTPRRRRSSLFSACRERPEKSETEQSTPKKIGPHHSFLLFFPFSPTIWPAYSSASQSTATSLKLSRTASRSHAVTLLVPRPPACACVAISLSLTFPA